MSRLLATILLLTVFARAERLVVLPERVELRGGEREHGLVILREKDGKMTDVTRLAKRVSSRPDVAVIGDAGQLLAKGDGEAEVAISLDALTAKVPVIVSDFANVKPPSFREDVLPVLTRAGCNMGGCHGKLAGQNGFRLSLRAFAPEWDHEWLTREVSGRRVNPAFPAESLILQKASGDLPHEGGSRFRKDSRAYRTLAAWIAARAPGPVADEAAPERIEMLPGSRVMQPGETQQLIVLAHYPGGRVRDVTWLAQFFANDESLVSVRPDGRAKALRAGEGVVRAHFRGLVQVARFTIPRDAAVADADFAERRNAVDAPIFEKLRLLRIPPSPAADDHTFIRRAYLDTIGVLPTEDEIRAFVADAAVDKRERLADALLARPEWADFWALQLADLLQNRRERDHDVRGVKGVRSFHAWLRARLAAGAGWDVIAREVLTARGDVAQNPAIGYHITLVGEHSRVEESELPDSAAQAFLGTRIGCARCHNHPLERYTQDDFYHLAAFFARESLDRVKPESGGTKLLTSTREEREAAKRLDEARAKLAKVKDESAAAGADVAAMEKKVAEEARKVAEAEKQLAEQRARKPSVTQPRTGAKMEPQGFDRVPAVIAADADPREAFVAWMLGTEQFPGAMVNRIWKHFMGAGLVEPVDDLRASNPPSNPELWALLVRDFAGNGYDLRRVMRTILTSRAYGLSSETRAGNETDVRFYSHYLARRLPAEVLLDAIADATGLPTAFPGHPLGLRAVQIPEPGIGNHFLALFGRSERVTACACERAGEVTLPQLLSLRNGEEMRAQISGGSLKKWLAEGDDAKLVDRLFIATFCRPPRDSERAAVAAALTGANREEVCRDLFWALLNAKEFSFNH